MNKQNEEKQKPDLRRLPFGSGRLAARFRRASVLLFLLTLFVMAAVMVAAFSGIVSNITADTAGQFASGAANSLSTHIMKEVSLLSAAANSYAVTQWLADEYDEAKKDLAYMELSYTIQALYSSSLYVTPVSSLNEYKIEGDYPYGGITHVGTLDAANPDDEWFFRSIDSDKDYTLDIALDKVSYGKRVWIDYKIKANGNVIGIIATGLEFAHIAGELFAHFDGGTTHGVVVNEDGIIYMDSLMLGSDDFLHSEYATSFETLHSEQVLASAVSKRLGNAGQYSDTDGFIDIIALSPRPYRYSAIAPIRHTDWLAVIVYDSSSLLTAPLFLPAAISMLVLLIVFALSINSISYRLVFLPLDKLRKSLIQLKEDNEEDLYGTQRNDEVGELSNSIKDWFTKANYDALTGIYNRRYMENSLHNALGILARSGGTLSVLMVDVDYFKKYNDTFGHEQGDVCLKSVAQAISAAVMRSGDFAARYGGEEFVLVLPNTGSAGACTIAEKIISNVRGLKLPHPKSDAADVVTISVGVASGKVEYGKSWEEYVKYADEALYASKQNGRNQYTCSGM